MAGVLHVTYKSNEHGSTGKYQQVASGAVSADATPRSGVLELYLTGSTAGGKASIKDGTPTVADEGAIYIPEGWPVCVNVGTGVKVAYTDNA